MINALSGFALLAVIVLVGWALRRWGDLPDDTEATLGRLAFLVLAPCLLFQGVLDADLSLLLSTPLLVSTLAAIVCFAVFAVIFHRRDPGTRIIGALAGGYTNANYIGLPIATYVLGDATLVVPIVFVQLVIITVAMALLEFGTRHHVSWRRVLLLPLRNPIVVAVTLGAVVAATGLTLPAVVLDPVTTIGQACVPVVLIAFGMSLSGRRVLAPGPERLPTIVAVLLKTLAMPVVAFLLAWAFGLSREAVYTVTVLAALPCAQNLFVYAQQAGAAVILIRDAIFLSTLACLPVMVVITLVLR
ncbi:MULTISPECIES: AEC family transporter [Actinoplanes]|uniref:AEC family transporter n=1 Tax=Actinoplanes TaxID=1865 RepID=UPI0005F2B134|nr:MULTISPECIES: AEC family transporter [Actinoplanes]GLY03823.1 membrane protein [Actinoplanes sp. NBRC 101535]